MQKSSSLLWIVVSLIGFILFVAFFYMLIVYSKDISISMPLYFFLVVIIALISTAFLSGAMKSVARFKASSQNRSLYLSGPAVIFFIIIYLGYKYRPESTGENSPLSLSVLLNGPEGLEESIKKGQVRVRIAQYSSLKQVDNEGTATFTGINPQYKGLKIDLSADIPGYNLVGKPVYVLSDSGVYTNLTLNLQKKLDSIAVRGNVIRLPGRTGIAGASVRFQGVMQTYKTDSIGDFSAILPFKSGVETRIIVSKGNREIYNSLRTISENDFLSISAN
ncbi:hypothetical protein [Daejeonella oryzae]|uniref:hypothetical protein n=1 Tax=Daejeonella oryzae TaxID=1122943 RepID=UPI00047D3487|nr:hypothetical protein [Daejeonella oryzae]